VRALPWAEKEADVRRVLLAAGFHEAIASTFCSATEAALTAPQPGLVAVSYTHLDVYKRQATVSAPVR